MELIYKLALFICSMTLLLLRPIETLSVVVFATALFIISVQGVLEKLALSAISLYALLALSIWKWEFALFIPAASYDVFKCKKWKMNILAVIILIITLMERPWVMAMTIVIAAISGILAYLYASKENLELELKSQRDSSVELSRVLRKRNEFLTERQESEIKLATLTERNRIAREIHDNVGHDLSRSILQTGAVTAINSDSALNQPLSDLKTTLNSAMDSIRNSVHDLHDESLDIEGYVSNMLSQIPGYNIKFDCDMSPDISRKVKYCFIAVVREAISNIVKHSNAIEIKVLMREHPALYQLLIEDNGTDIRENTSGGLGLHNMQERVEALGGTININASNGFAIFIAIQKEEGIG